MLLGIGAACTSQPDVRITPVGVEQPTEATSSPPPTDPPVTPPPPPPPADEQGNVRVAHLALIGPLALFIDGGRPDGVIPPFGATPFIQVATGDHRVAVSAGQPPNAPGARLELTVPSGAFLTGLVFGVPEDLRFDLSADDATGLAAGNARFVVLNAAFGAKSFDVVDPVTGELYIEHLVYGASAAIDLAAGPRTLALDTDRDGAIDWTYDLADAPDGAVVRLPFASFEDTLIAATFTPSGDLVAIHPDPVFADTGL